MNSDHTTTAMGEQIEEQESGSSPRALTVAGASLVAILGGVSLGLVFQGGAYGGSTWLPVLMGVAALALMLAIAGPKVTSGRFQKVIIALFALQAVWTAASTLWATSLANAWEETNRTLLYALAVMLVFTAVRWGGATALRALAGSLITVAGAVVVFALVTLLLKDDPLSLFADGRLNYPVTYYNGLAALLMVGFWLALGVANGPRSLPKTDAAGSQTDSQSESAGTDETNSEETNSEETNSEETNEVKSRSALRRTRARATAADRLPRWTQPVLLVLSVVLLEVALLPQSRGAFWAFFLVLPFFIIFSSHRFRAFFDLVIVVIPVVIFWRTLNGPYSAINGGTSLDTAIIDAFSAIGYSVAIVLGAWVVSWLVERRVGPLRRRVVVWISVGLAVLAIFAASAGVVYSDLRSDGLGDYLGDRWEEFTSDQGGDVGSGSRFAAVGLNGRLQQWEVAAKAGAEDLGLGLGAQNFEYYWYQHRTSTLDVRQPHSQPMQLFAELGVPGLALWLAFVIACLVHAAIVRFKSPGRADRAIVAAMMTAVVSWFIHSSADWLWQLAAVSLPALMLLGGLAGTGWKPSGPSLAVSSDRRSYRALLIRGLAALVAVVIVASAAFPYLSVRYSNLAAGSRTLDEATAKAQTAAALDPTAVLPYAVRADAHRAAAAEAPLGSTERFHQLRLAATAWEEALDREPASWVYQYQAAAALLAARDAALAAGSGSTEELEEQARIYLAEARRLNPRSSQVEALERLLGTSGYLGQD